MNSACIIDKQAGKFQLFEQHDDVVDIISIFIIASRVLNNKREKNMKKETGYIITKKLYTAKAFYLEGYALCYNIARR